MYDSFDDTYAHMRLVQGYLLQIIDNLGKRAIDHDRSKIEEPEKSAFDALGNATATTTYGSPEYFNILKETLGPALEHHYETNDHHPQYHANKERPLKLLDEIQLIQNGVDTLLSLELEAPHLVALREWLEVQLQVLENPITMMSLLSIVEMSADWKAASQRYANGSFEQSLSVNRGRFFLGSQLYWILQNTQEELGW